jgi:transcriptional regulator with GAF, ATPase, and Fis domain
MHAAASKELSAYANPAPVHLQTGFPSVRELKEKQMEDDRALILNALRQAGGNKAKAARLLGIDRSLLYYRMKKLGIE